MSDYENTDGEDQSPFGDDDDDVDVNTDATDSSIRLSNLRISRPSGTIEAGKIIEFQIDLDVSGLGAEEEKAGVIVIKGTSRSGKTGKKTYKRKFTNSSVMHKLRSDQGVSAGEWTFWATAMCEGVNSNTDEIKVTAK